MNFVFGAFCTFLLVGKKFDEHIFFFSADGNKSLVPVIELALNSVSNQTQSFRLKCQVICLIM